MIAKILFIVSGIVWGIELIPQIIKTVKRKSVKDVSLMMFVMCETAYMIYFVAAYLIREYVLIIAHIPSAVLLAVMICLVIKYRGNDDKVQKRKSRLSRSSRRRVKKRVNKSNSSSRSRPHSNRRSIRSSNRKRKVKV